MDSEPRLFKIDPLTQQSRSVRETDFATMGFQERRDIQEWVAADPSILGEELLIIAKEFSGFDRTNERADLVAVDRDGNIVVIELKRDDTGADVHWQAIKYASYFKHAQREDIVRMLADHAKVTEDEAVTGLIQHLDMDDLESLNRGQRIILASHRFAPEVTSAVIWLNENTQQQDLVTCITLTPYQDDENGSFYIQASTIIPVPGTEELAISIGSGKGGDRRSFPSGAVKKEDDVTRYLRGIALEALSRVSEDLKPDRKSRWAGIGSEHRYFHVWYARPPWSNWGMSYQLMLFGHDDSADVRLITSFKCQKEYMFSREQFSDEDIEALRVVLENQVVIPGLPGQELIDDGKWLELKITLDGHGLDESLAEQATNALHMFIEAITPAVDEFANERNE